MIRYRCSHCGEWHRSMVGELAREVFERSTFVDLSEKCPNTGRMATYGKPEMRWLPSTPPSMPVLTGPPDIKLTSKDLCPCGSKKPIATCWPDGPDGSWPHPPHAKVFPPAPPSGFAHPDCYAKQYSDCISKLSNEHYVSESLVTELELNKGIVSGLVFQDPGKTKVAGPEVYRSRVLCRRHNSALSPLDDVARRFGRALRTLVSLGHPSSPAPIKDEYWAFNGHDIERWIAKCLAGAMTAGVLRRREVRAGALPVPDRVLALLFGERQLEKPAGLYFFGGLPTLASADMGFRAVWDEQYSDIVGMEVRIHSIDMLLWLESTPPPPVRFPPQEMTFRSAGKYSWRVGKYVAVGLHWEGEWGPFTQIAHLPKKGKQSLTNFPVNERWHHWGRSPLT